MQHLECPREPFSGLEVEGIAWAELQHMGHPGSEPTKLKPSHFPSLAPKAQGSGLTLQQRQSSLGARRSRPRLPWCALRRWTAAQ